MTFLTTITSSIGLCLQAGITFWLQAHFFSHRFNRRLAVLSGMILYLTVSMAASYTLARQGWYLLYSILRQGSLILLLILYFQGRLWHRASLAAILCASSEFADNALVEMLSLVCMFLPAKWQTFSVLFIDLFYPVATLFLWYAFRHMHLRPDIFTRQICQLLFYTMCGLMLLTDIVYHGITHGIIMISHTGQPEVFNPYTSELLTYTECIILSLLSLSMALCLPAALNKIMHKTLSEQIQRTQIAHYQTLLEEHQRQVSLRHDLKNHLLVLEGLTQQGELEKISEYLKAMCQETYKTTGNIHTGSLTADALIDIKEQAALSKDISFTWEISLPKHLSMEDFDLCILLGNLLDNSIQAAGGIPDEKERRIFLQAKPVKRNLLIEIENTVAKESSPPHFGTEHYGTGLQNVKHIIEKYNGVMDISSDTSRFCVSILLPVYDTMQTI